MCADIINGVSKNLILYNYLIGALDRHQHVIIGKSCPFIKHINAFMVHIFEATKAKVKVGAMANNIPKSLATLAMQQKNIIRSRGKNQKAKAQTILPLPWCRMPPLRFNLPAWTSI